MSTVKEQMLASLKDRIDDMHLALTSSPSYMEKITSEDFKKYFLDYFLGKVDNSKLRKIWIERVAGSVFNEVSITLNGEHVVTVPALADTGIISSENLRLSNKAKGTINDKLENTSNDSNIPKHLYHEMINNNLINRYGRNMPNASEGYIQKWDILFAYFGTSLNNDGSTDSKPNSNDDNDSFEMEFPD